VERKFCTFCFTKFVFNGIEYSGDSISASEIQQSIDKYHFKLNIETILLKDPKAEKMRMNFQTYFANAIFGD